MPSRTATIASSVGLHARPAALFVQEASGSGLDVRVGRPGDEPVHATSILGLRTLGAKLGETVEVTVDGEGAEGVLDELVTLLETDLDEA